MILVFCDELNCSILRLWNDFEYLNGINDIMGDEFLDLLVERIIKVITVPGIRLCFL